MNVMRLRSLDDRVRRQVFAAVDRLNALAEASAGFVWRLPAEGGHFHPFGGDPLMSATLSVWRSYADLHRFTYRSDHGFFTTNRRRWFDPLTGPTTVLWWVPAGSRPSLADGEARLARLHRLGPTPDAFSLLGQFDERGRPVPRRRPGPLRSAARGGRRD